MEEDKIVRAGYLRKKGHLVRSWKKRWFVLSQQKTLFYFKSPQSKKPQGIIHLDSYSVEILDDLKLSKQLGIDGIRALFLLIHPEKKQYLLCASSEEEMSLWISTLLQEMNKQADCPVHYRKSFKGTQFESESLALSSSPSCPEAITLSSSNEKWTFSKCPASAPHVLVSLTSNSTSFLSPSIKLPQYRLTLPTMPISPQSSTSSTPDTSLSIPSSFIPSASLSSLPSPQTPPSSHTSTVLSPSLSKLPTLYPNGQQRAYPLIRESTILIYSTKPLPIPGLNT